MRARRSRSPRCAWARRRPSTRCARRCRWAPTRASTSSTTRSPGSDYIATSLVLAKAIEKIGRDQRRVDLVVCGMASTDAAGSVVPAMLAERLGLPQVTLASVVESQGDQVRIKRDDEGSTEVIGATLPLVLSVTDQSGEARYPSFKGIMAAKKKPLETCSLADLGVDAGQVGLSVAWTQVEDTDRPPAAHRRRDRQGRGRLGRHGAGRVPRVQEVHLSRTGESTCLKSWWSIDHADGEVKKPTYELLTIAAPPRRAVRGVHRRARQGRRRGREGQEVRRREGLRRSTTPRSRATSWPPRPRRSSSWPRRPPRPRS